MASFLIKTTEVAWGGLFKLLHELLSHENPKTKKQAILLWPEAQMTKVR